MIELLVAVAILTTIMLSFSMIMTQVQETVSTGQKTIRTNAAAAAIIDTIRNDIRQMTQHGMLCITQAFDGSPRLVVSTSGVTPSKTHGQLGDPPNTYTAIGTGGIISVGRCLNHATSTTTREILFYQRWVLMKLTDKDEDELQWPFDILRTRDPAGDWETYDLADFQVFTRGGTNYLVDDICNLSPSDDPGSLGAIRIPPKDDDIGSLWQVLAENCESLSIMWTDGTATAYGLNWYGVDNPNSPLVTVTPAQWETDPNKIEFNAVTWGEDTYRALWTHHNQNNWPRAIKIRFELVEGEERNTYEVICPVGG